MSYLSNLVRMFIGPGRNVVAETIEVFRENAEAAGVRDADSRGKALAQFAAEFSRESKSPFDRMIDGLNRLPRPLMAYGILGLFVVAMVDPVWFAARMQGLALVPEPLWWLMGAIVSFYFGSRYQTHTQEFQRSIAETIARVPEVAANLSSLETMQDTAAKAAAPPPAPEHLVKSRPVPEPELNDIASSDPNPALIAWSREAR